MSLYLFILISGIILLSSVSAPYCCRSDSEEKGLVGGINKVDRGNYTVVKLGEGSQREELREHDVLYELERSRNWPFHRKGPCHHENLKRLNFR
jgi:hypothetical protein